jgi:hypothetical protein
VVAVAGAVATVDSLGVRRTVGELDGILISGRRRLVEPEGDLLPRIC